MKHNSFDIEILPDGSYQAVSHNFRECIGEGPTEKEALDQMDRKIMYLADNSPQEYKNRIRERLRAGLECACGHELKGKILGIVGPFL